LDKKNPEMGTESVAVESGEANASKDCEVLLGKHSQATGRGGGGSDTQRHVNSADGGGSDIR